MIVFLCERAYQVGEMRKQEGEEGIKKNSGGGNKAMPGSEVYQCKCPHCQQETPHPDQELHRQMNLRLAPPG
jgi:hypothetical protein